MFPIYRVCCFNIYIWYIAVDLDPRSKILGKTSWIQGLDPRSKIQDYRKNFLDPRSGSKIQDPRLQKKLLGSTAEPSLGSGKALSSDPRSFFWNLRSWIQEVFSVILDLGSRPWIQKVFSVILDLGSKKFFLESWILDLGSRPWIQEAFSVILDLGSWIQINCYGSIVFINVYKRLETCQNPPCPEKGFREGPKYWKNQD